jgi:hypothetical protein
VKIIKRIERILKNFYEMKKYGKKIKEKYLKL